jgi:hypothetical protein
MEGSCSRAVVYLSRTGHRSYTHPLKLRRVELGTLDTVGTPPMRMAVGLATITRAPTSQAGVHRLPPTCRVTAVLRPIPPFVFSSDGRPVIDNPADLDPTVQIGFWHVQHWLDQPHFNLLPEARSGSN